MGATSSDCNGNLIPDAFEPGRKYAETVATILTDNDASVKIVELFCVPTGGSVSDFIEAHDSRGSDDLRRSIEQLADEAIVWKPEPITQTTIRS